MQCHTKFSFIEQIYFKYVDELTGERPLGMTRQRREEDIKMDPKKISVNTKNSVDSAQDRDYWRVLENAALRLRVS